MKRSTHAKLSAKARPSAKGKPSGKTKPSAKVKTSTKTKPSTKVKPSPKAKRAKKARPVSNGQAPQEVGTTSAETPASPAESTPNQAMMTPVITAPAVAVAAATNPAITNPAITNPAITNPAITNPAAATPADTVPLSAAPEPTPSSIAALAEPEPHASPVAPASTPPAPAPVPETLPAAEAQPALEAHPPLAATAAPNTPLQPSNGNGNNNDSNGSSPSNSTPAAEPGPAATLLRIEAQLKELNQSNGGFWHRLEQATPFLATVVLAAVTAFFTYGISVRRADLAQKQADQAVLQQNFDNASKGRQAEFDKITKEQQVHLDRLEKLSKVDAHLWSDKKEERQMALAILASLGETTMATRLAATVHDPLAYDTLLATAASIGDAELVKMTLALGANPNYRNENRDTPLILAAQRNHLEVVQLLVEAGANLESVGSAKMTPLMIATHDGHPQIVEALLSAGAKLDTECVKDFPAFLYLYPIEAEQFAGETSLYYDGVFGAHFRFNPEVARLFTQRGVDINQFDVGPDTLAGFIARYCPVATMAENIALGLDINRQSDADTPLMAAAESASPEMVDLLLKHGAQVNAKGSFDSTALSYAVREGTPSGGASFEAAFFREDEANRTHVVVSLLEAQAHLEDKDQNGMTPLLHAVENGYASTVALLLQRGADLHAKAEEGESALMVAFDKEKPDSAMILLNFGADPNDRDEQGTSALEEAVSNADPESLKHHEGRPNLKSIDFTSLSHGVIELLLAKGAKAVNPALLRAVRNNDAWSVTTLLKAGADPKTKDAEGKSALEIARDNNATDVIPMLQGNAAAP